MLTDDDKKDWNKNVLNLAYFNPTSKSTCIYLIYLHLVAPHEF